MSGMLINIAIPSLERIEAMQDQVELCRLLESADQIAEDLTRYRRAMILRLLNLRGTPRKIIQGIME